MTIHITLWLNNTEKINVKLNCETTIGDIKYFIMLNIMFKKFPILYKVPFYLYLIHPMNFYDLNLQHNHKHISNIILFELTWFDKLQDDYTLTDLIKNNILTIGKRNNILVIVTPNYSYFKKVYNNFFRCNKIKTEICNNITYLKKCNINHLVKFIPIDILSYNSDILCDD